MRQLRAGIERLNDKQPIAGLKGSDSPTQRFEKKGTKAVLKEFKNKKGITTSKEPRIQNAKRRQVRRALDFDGTVR